jgi:hypothetical protein
MALIATAVFGLANAGVTQSVPYAGSIIVAMTGLYAANLLKERAVALEMRSQMPSRVLVWCAFGLPVFLLVAFAVLFEVQFTWID